MEKKTFAFKLADKSAKSDGKWKARDGVALAGCTELPNLQLPRQYLRQRPPGPRGRRLFLLIRPAEQHGPLGRSGGPFAARRAPR